VPHGSELKGRNLHLLGGTPQKQARYIVTLEGAGAHVLSLDGNVHDKLSTYNWLFTDSGKWQRPATQTTRTDKYAVMQQSAINIAHWVQQDFPSQLSLF
jgi:hypothetical protein